MEVMGDRRQEYQLVLSRDIGDSKFLLVHEDTTRAYYAIQRKGRVNIVFEFVGTERADAIDAFQGFCDDYDNDPVTRRKGRR